MAGSSVSIDLTANLAKWTTSIDKATNDLTKFASNAERQNARIANSFDKLFLGLKTIIPSGLFINFLKGTIDAADNLKDLSETTGFSIETLAGLEVVAKQSGSSLEGLSTGIKYLQKNIFDANNGNEQLASMLSAIGVTSKDGKEALFQLADAFKNLIPESEKSAVAMKLLGRSGAELVPTLNQGGEALKKMDKSAASYAKSMAELAPLADDFNDKMVTFKNNVTEAGAALLIHLLPPLNTVFENIKQARALSGKGFSFMELLGLGINPTQGPAEQLKKVNDEIRIAEKELSLLSGIDIFGEKQAWNEKLSQLYKLRKAIEEIQVAAKDTSKVVNDPKNSILPAIKFVEFQDAIKKAFNTSAIDKFSAKFADARQKIQVEYAKLKASFTGAPIAESTGLDLNATIQQGKRALSGGDSVQAQALLDKAKEMFTVVAGKDTTTSYEKTYFADTLKNFELAMVDNQEKIQKASDDAFKTAVDKSVSDIGKFNIPIDVDAMVNQFKQALGLMQAEMQRNPLTPSPTYVPQYSSDGRVSVDISNAALKFGSR